ncbi:hypothetical protein AXI64_gp102 [Vibrio phage qdvp001]|uniref:hypothetical protein n=1 Tax=Vibrio phage qdvp001 TaxID=1003177 RepID=UPI00072005BA|nr:hypothetical protein AXI64_gp102 [Vibrio phage qdvp001]ALM62094.1 hypothetical protein qdvp001_102 [Vibrio phage qdvp001]
MDRKPCYEYFDYTALLNIFPVTTLWNDEYSIVSGDYSNHKYKTRSLPKRLVPYLEMIGSGNTKLGVYSVIEFILRDELQAFSRTIHKNGNVIFYPAQYNEITGEGNYMSQGVELHVEYIRGKVKGVYLVARYEEKERGEK